MYILGIDPGSRNIGYGIISLEHSRLSLVEAGLIKIRGGEFQDQIGEMVEGFDLLFREFPIDQVAMEDIFYAYNPKTVLKLAQFRGAIALRIIQLHGPFSEYNPLQVKQAITGTGRATKRQVSYMVAKILGVRGEVKPLDITDALAVAVTHAQRVRLKGYP
ncbi:MAG: crossover junction endodeoxyribonuclease RuvC [Epsilonproteobacteria bacterium]|nr:crossover junction endodeoxyribonuclease RuvC [Campylobacterota bacterium]NPA56980.1 crossover junction endodeoxyribonuclease RuvC [Campylobacterota bacterium]